MGSEIFQVVEKSPILRHSVAEQAPKQGTAHLGERRVGKQVLSFQGLSQATARRIVLLFRLQFFMAVQKDGRISVTHIGVYAALLQYSITKGHANPIHVFAKEIMKISKISSRATYYRCVTDLSTFGYIKYTPSFKCKRASTIYFPQ